MYTFDLSLIKVQSSKLMHNRPKKRHSTINIQKILIKGTTIIQIRMNILQKVPCMFKDICAFTYKRINDEL